MGSGSLCFFVNSTVYITFQIIDVAVIPESFSERVSSIFDPCWRNEVSNFRLRKFAQVVPFCEPNGADVDINTENSLDNSGSNESMKKVLASIV